jgi:hypothetical protein
MTPSHFYETVNLCGKIDKEYRFLELGTSTGIPFFNLLSVDKKFTVDLKIPDFLKEYENAYEMTTDVFFQTTQLKNFNLIFIDADHRYMQALKDYNSSVNLLEKSGIIVLHDCYPPSESLCDDYFCSDSYKLLEVLSRTGQEVFYSKEHFGITLVKNPKLIDEFSVNHNLSYREFIEKMSLYDNCIEYPEFLLSIIENSIQKNKSHDNS